MGERPKWCSVKCLCLGFDMKLGHLNIPELVKAYQAGTSAVKLAHTNHVSVWAVLKRLRDAGVQIRPSGVRKMLGLAPEATSILREIVDGLLLGDGSIAANKPSLRIEQSADRDGWLTELQAQLACIGVWSNSTRIPPKTKMIDGRSITKGWSRVLYTSVCDEMRAERLRWYPDKIKRIPADIVLSPRTIALWFAGDGTYNGYGNLFFCTNGFLREEVEGLADALSVFGVQAYCAPAGRFDEYKVNVTKRDDAERLRVLMDPFLPTCCTYKLRFVRPAIPRGSHMRRFTDQQVTEIRSRCAAGEVQTALAVELGTSQAAISQIVRRKAYRLV
jgi:hypothetical protein